MRSLLSLILLFLCVACAAPIKALPQKFEAKHTPELAGAKWQEVGIGAAWNTGFNKEEEGLLGEPQIWVLTEKLTREKTGTGWKYSGEVGLVHLDDRFIERIFVFALAPASEISPHEAEILAVTEIPFERIVVFENEEDQVIPFELEWGDDDGQTHAIYALVIAENKAAALSTLNYANGRTFPDPVLWK